MAITIPNLGTVQKISPKLGEALQKIQNYSNLNITPAPGNRIPVPPIDAISVKT